MTIMNNFLNVTVGVPLGLLMFLCLEFTKNYGLAIIVFTLLTKIILFPLNIMVQKNSIKMVKIQPELNNIAAQNPDNPDLASEEQFKLYKRENYHPLAGLIPMMIQIPLVLGVLQVIYNPLQHLLRLPKEVVGVITNHAVELLKLSEAGSSIQAKAIDLIHNPLFVDSFRNLECAGADMPAVIQKILDFNMSFGGINLAAVPSLKSMDILLLIPLLAGASSLLLCVCQNQVNVLQKEQGFIGKWGMALFLVMFSMYFAMVVPAGVGIYWTASNLFSIAALYLVNWLYKPEDYIDYDALEKSKLALAQSKEVQKSRRLSKEDKVRAKADYKAFCKDENKQLVFYSEKNGFYKYFKSVLEYILEHSDVTIHYVTSDPADDIFKLNHPQIKPYFIDDNRLIPLFMKIDSDIAVMTVPDLENFHLKRSYVRKDVEYIYMFHYPLSTTMVLRKGALDHYDTIFCVGEFQFDEIRQTENLYGLKEKKLVNCGYGLLGDLITQYENMNLMERGRKKILIAPSWQEANILDSCLVRLLDQLLGKGFDVYVRPHPEYIKRYGMKMNEIVSRYSDYKGGDLYFELDFTSSNSLFDSDIVISDWSGAAYEFAFITKKPVLFINTPPKINNPEYDRIEARPLELTLRDKVGAQLEMDQLDKVYETTCSLLKADDEYKERITSILNNTISYLGKQSGEIGGQYILDRLKERKKYEG